MANGTDGLIVIGENINTTRKIAITSPRIARNGATVGVRYTDLGGKERILDCTDTIPQDPAEQEGFMIPHVAQALKKKDLAYLTWVIQAQERAGAHIIDLCVDEMSPYPEQRKEWMCWLVKTAQSITDAVISIDSSDTDTIRAGLEVYDCRRSRPAINSFNLEEGRRALAELAREHDAVLFANASGATGMPQNAEERVSNLTECMKVMDEHGIAQEDRYLDPLVFPVGADGKSGNHYLNAVKTLRKLYPKVHIFGGHSNVSFGLPRRRALNQAFTLLAISAGCDAIMIDPIMNSPKPFEEFLYSTGVLAGQDEFAMRYLQYCRSS